MDGEKTRAVAMFFRDITYSSTESVVVSLVLALDTPICAPPVIAWELAPRDEGRKGDASSSGATVVRRGQALSLCPPAPPHEPSEPWRQIALAVARPGAELLACHEVL